MPNITKGKKPTAFGRKVKKRLIDLDMSQAELARQIGTSTANLSYILYGDNTNEAWIPKIRAALGMKQRGENLDESRCG